VCGVQAAPRAQDFLRIFFHTAESARSASMSLALGLARPGPLARPTCVRCKEAADWCAAPSDGSQQLLPSQVWRCTTKQPGTVHGMKYAVCKRCLHERCTLPHGDKCAEVGSACDGTQLLIGCQLAA
jgi:hypothetical protein